jgi:microfibrillar-associated protein 1
VEERASRLTSLPVVPEKMSSAARGWGDDAREKDRKGGAALARVARYRRGQKPSWLQDEAAGESDSDGEARPDGSQALLRTQKGLAQTMSIHVTGEQQPDSSSRPRERRIIAPAVVEKRTAGRDGAHLPPRRHREVIAVPSEVHAKRTALKKKLLEEEQRRATFSKKATTNSDDSDVSDDEDSDDESDDDYTSDGSDSDGDVPIARPVFVRKQDRQTLAEREAIEREELERIEKEKAQAAKQAQESRKIAQEKVAAELALEAAARAGPQGAEEIVTDDEADPEGDHARWKEREMARLRRSFARVLRAAYEEKERQAWAALSDREKERYLKEKTRAARSDARNKAEQKAREREARGGDRNPGVGQTTQTGRALKGAFFRDE